MNRYIFFILIMQITTFSCKKEFLEVADNTVLLKQAYVVDLTTTGHFMNGIYIAVAGRYLNAQTLAYPEYVADNLKPVGNYPFPVYYWSQLADVKGEANFNGFWMQGYQIIRDCSFVTEQVDKYQIENQQLANEIKGQALAIRALIHFVMVNTFAQPYNFTPDANHPGVPYIQTSDIEPAVSRQSVAEVYSRMIEDLNASLQLLPNNVATKELMNYHAAKALLARVYLFKSDYINAKELSRQVLTDIPLMIDGYPENLYTKNETEALFHMPPGYSSADNYYALYLGYAVGVGNAFVATNDIAQLLQEDLNDKRSAWVNSSSQGWAIMKFPKSATGQFPIADGDHYQTVLRSSEMALTAAEAYANLNIEDSAQYYINAIRKRANPTLIDITATGAALIDTIYKERRKEMSFDGLRMFDLLRWKKVLTDWMPIVLTHKTCLIQVIKLSLRFLFKM